MSSFEEFIRNEVQDYAGPQAELIRHAPDLYVLLANLLGAPDLPPRLRPLVMAAIGYFALADEVLDEDLRGPLGYLDDMYLAALAAEMVRQAAGLETLTDAWEGQGEVGPLVREILQREHELVGDRRELILWLIGYEHMNLEAK